MGDQDDWVIDASGFYVASRSFLIRRGFCCANQCRNCPYINWRGSPTWEPLPAEAVYEADVSPKAIEGARKALAEIERQQQRVSQATEARDPRLAAHYRLLLERWKASKGNSSEGGGK
jgi:Family of unknown function (DUF5522)